jgi:FkbM family methyltransferase
MQTHVHPLLRLRPARLGSAIASLCGLSRRRFVTTNEGTFFVNPVSIFGNALANGAYEPKMQQVLATYLPEGGVFIDLGANEGYYSVLASKVVGPRGMVSSIEPQLRLQSVIQRNLEVNNCFNVRVVRCVLSDHSGTAQIALAPDSIAGASSLFPAHKSRPTEEVRSFTLPEFLHMAGIERCDLMKVDIEGAEYDVFMPAREVLRAGIVRNIAMEYHHSVFRSRGLSCEDLHTCFLENGYRLNEQLGHWVYSWDAQ